MCRKVAANCVPEKIIAYEKYTCGKLAATSCSTPAAYALQVCSNSVPQGLYFGKGSGCITTQGKDGKGEKSKFEWSKKECEHT